MRGFEVLIRKHLKVSETITKADLYPQLFRLQSVARADVEATTFPVHGSPIR